MKTQRAALLTLTAIQFTHIVDFMILMPLGPQLMRVFMLSPKQFGLLVSIYTLSAGISGFVASFVVDRFDRKKTLRTIFVLFLFATVSCAFAPTYHTLLLARLFAGAFGGILASTVLVIVSDLVPLHERGSAMGLVMIGFALASVIGVPLGLFLASIYSWHIPFIFLGCVGIAVLIAIERFIPTMSEHIRKNQSIATSIKSFEGFFQTKPTLAAMSLTFTMVLGQFALIPFISPYMVYNVGFSEKQLSLIYILGGLASVVASPLVGKLADRIGHTKVFRVAACLSIIPIIAITNLGHVGLAIALCFTTSFFIIVSGRVVPAMALVSSAVKPEKRGSFMALNTCIQQLTAGIGSVISARIIIKSSTGELLHYSKVGLLAATTSLIAAVLVGMIKEVE